MSEPDIDLDAIRGTAETQKKVRGELAVFEKNTLRVIALTAGAIYLVRAIASVVFFTIDEALIIVAPLAISFFISVSILIALRYGGISTSLVRPLSVLLLTLITCNVFYILHATGNLSQFYFSSLVLVAFGLGTSTFLIWLVLAVPFAIVFLVSLFVLDVTPMAPYIASLIGGSALSLVAYYVRAPVFRKLVESQLVQAEIAKKLRLSNKAKDQFLANMTHELRTPMTGVMGMIDLMLTTELTSEQQYYLGTARKSARYLLTVINDILDVAKLEAGKMIVNAEDMDAVTVSKDIVSLFEMRFKQKNLVLKLTLPDTDIVPVKGDSVRIGQILLNLLENALKFTNEGSVTIILHATCTDETTTLKWTVQDTGIGIPADRLETLFDRFEQVDSSATRTTHGTGLGLAIIRDIIHLMGGKVGAQSVVGKGSMFWFTLQLPTVSPDGLNKAVKLPLTPHATHAKAMEYADPPAMHDDPLSRSDDTNNDIDRPRILFAEDNPVNRELIARLIKREGWVGTPVTNGQEAVDAVKVGATSYDLILMDIQMPIMDGLTASNIIKHELTSTIPIVALTANTLPDDIVKYNQAGFEAIIGKPIDVVEFRSAIERLTSLRQ